jgi:hypothetical protein
LGRVSVAASTYIELKLVGSKLASPEYFGDIHDNMWICVRLGKMADGDRHYRRESCQPGFGAGLPDFSWYNVPEREKYTK